jgi:hypothetical protein
MDGHPLEDVRGIHLEPSSELYAGSHPWPATPLPEPAPRTLVSLVGSPHRQAPITAARPTDACQATSASCPRSPSEAADSQYRRPLDDARSRPGMWKDDHAGEHHRACFSTTKARGLAQRLWSKGVKVGY